LFRRFRKAGLFGVFTDVRTDTTRASVDEIFGELGAVCGERPVSSQERDDAVNGLLLGYPADFESISDVARRIAMLPILSRPLDWYQRWPERVAAVTTEQANQAGRDFCDSSSYEIMLAGDREKVEPALASLGRPVVVYDAQGQPQK
jgi:predicted Zn-dependent peptidase